MSTSMAIRARALRVVGAALAVVLLASITGCGNGDPSPDSATPDTSTAEPDPRTQGTPPSDEGATGTLSFELRAAGGVTLDALDYVITGPHFSRSGKIDVKNSTTVSARIDGIPAASGYSVTLSADSVGTTKAQCSGSASFSVQARTETSVPVAISCRVADAVMTPPDAEPRPAPLPPFVTWMSGLALLAIGSRWADQRSRAKTAA